MAQNQLTLFEDVKREKQTSTFVKNMSLPVHRWFRYSAGFSASWAESVIVEVNHRLDGISVLDPFAGSATTLLAAEDAGVPSYGIESHPFVARLARAKLMRNHDPDEFKEFARRILANAEKRKRSSVVYPDLIERCYTDEHLDALDRLRSAFNDTADSSPASELSWLTLVGILRRTSHAGTAQWQYVLPKKSKKNVAHPFDAFRALSNTVYHDMHLSQDVPGIATLTQSDARTCQGIEDGTIDLVLTSPPYPNNYDYADATRLEMMFMREIDGWSDLQSAVRDYLVRSCSQHTTSKNTDLELILDSAEVAPIRDDLRCVCAKLQEVRQTKGGKKNYHLMIAAYFHDLARVWHALRRVSVDGSEACFVIGDSAPYGVHVAVPDWLGRLAIAAGFRKWRFEKIRDRNIKWKNRKHRVPLCEGRLWVDG